jgi:hypothetical protein
LEILLAGGALGGAEIGALVGLLSGALVGLGVGLRQQISFVNVLKVVAQVTPQPSHVTPISRSPELQLLPTLPTPHAVSYLISSAVHCGAVGLGVAFPQQISFVNVLKVVEQVKPQPSHVTLISRSPELQLPMPHAVSYRTSPEPHKFCCSRRRAEVFGQIGGAASPSGGPAGRGPSSMGAGARASDRFAASAERPRKGASRQDSASALSSVEERSTASAQLESSPTRKCSRVPTSVSATQPARHVSVRMYASMYAHALHFTETRLSPTHELPTGRTMIR